MRGEKLKDTRRVFRALKAEQGAKRFLLRLCILMRMSPKDDRFGFPEGGCADGAAEIFRRIGAGEETRADAAPENETFFIENRAHTAA